MIGPTSQHKPRFSNDDKNLIAEQPGRTVLFLGVLLAMTLGLIVRGVLAPNKVKAHVTAAASSINKDLQVEFETASVSLSRGLLPRFAVVITNVRMESKNECWMTPSLTADEIRLPLSLWALVQGKNPVTEVGAGKVRIDLRSDLKNCNETNSGTAVSAASPAATQAPVVTQFVTLKNKKTEPSAAAAQPQVEAVRIDELTISSPMLTAPLELSSFAVQVQSASPRVIEVTAKTHLIRDEQFGDYLSHAAVSVEYTEFPKTHVAARIHGNWREGSYELKTGYGVKDDTLTAELDLKHVPLVQVGQVLKKFKWVQQDLNARQVWVSVHAETSGKTKTVRDSGLRIADLRLEGELGDIRVNEAQVTSLDPLRYKPFQVDIQGLNIEKLLALLNRQHPSQALGHLGRFSGRAEVSSDEEMRLFGVLRGLEFIFANKGQREVQTLTEVSTDLRLVKNRWNLNASKAVVDQGMLDGVLQMNADRDLRNVDVETKIKELRLAPSVIRLMSAGGKVGPISADLRARLRESQPANVKGTIATADLLIEGVSLDRSKWQVDTVRNEVIANGQMQDLEIAATSPAFAVLKDIIDPAWVQENALEIRSLNSQLQFQSAKHLAWKNLTANLNGGVKVTSEGQWDALGILSGQVTAISGKNVQSWVLGGRRDAPLFALTETSKKRKQ